MIPTFRSLPIALACLVALPFCAADAAPSVKSAPPAVTKPAAANWLDVIVATPEGGLRQGNPNAKVKLLEFGSLTCPHCAAFARGGVPTLRSQYIATGKVSYEYRPFLLNAVDFAPALLVRCEEPAAAIKLLDAFYEQQAQWTLPFTKSFPEDVQKRLSTLTKEQQITAFAVQGGLDTFMGNRGMQRAKFDACTSDKAGIAKLEEIRTDADTNYGLTAVPTFVINGKTVPDTHDWSKLKPAIDAAL